MQKFQETTQRQDISLFHAARQSALCDPLVSEFLQHPVAPILPIDHPEEECADQSGIVAQCESQNRLLPAGSTLYVEGDNCKELFILLDGWVSVSRALENGRRLILNFLLPGSFPGFQTDLSAPMENTAQCLTASVVCAFPKKEFAKILEWNSPLALSLGWSKAEDEKKMQDNLINIAMRPARARLAHFLLNMHCLHVQSYPEQECGEVFLPLTQQDIADTLGLSLVHTNRAFRALHRERVVIFRKNRMQVQDLPQLQAIASLSDS